MARKRGITVEHALYGPVTPVNTADWGVTLLCGALLVYLIAFLGGARHETTLAGLWILAAGFVCHGLWMLAHGPRTLRFNWVPLLFLPLLGWQAYSTFVLSPAEWRGRLELIHGVQAFLFFWLLVNNARLRVHVWGLLALAILGGSYAAACAFNQVVRKPDFFASGGFGAPELAAPERFAGQATGSFGDPSTLAAFCLVLAAGLLFAACAPRLAGVLRILFLYVVLMLVAALVFSGAVWPLYAAAPVLFAVLLLGIERLRLRLLWLALLAVAGTAAWAVAALVNPALTERLSQAVAEDAGVVRGRIWSEAFAQAAASPLAGNGAGSFALLAERGEGLSMVPPPDGPHSDVLLWAAQYGIVGIVLFALPVALLALHATGICLREPFRKRNPDAGTDRMPAPRFFAAAGLAMGFAYLVCALFWTTSAVPALYLTGAAALALVTKASPSHQFSLPGHLPLRVGYALLAAAAGIALPVLAAPALRAAAAELDARQLFDRVLEQRAAAATGGEALDAVLEGFRSAVTADPGNADAWLGLSAATRQRFFSEPGRYLEIAGEAAAHAERALALAPGHWECHAQLGLGRALAGRHQEAGAQLEQAVGKAPGNPAAQYYLAAFLAGQPGRRDEALAAAEASLAIDPDNRLALRLRSKLLIP